MTLHNAHEKGEATNTPLHPICRFSHLEQSGQFSRSRFPQPFDVQGQRSDPERSRRAELEGFVVALRPHWAVIRADRFCCAGSLRRLTGRRGHLFGAAVNLLSALFSEVRVAQPAAYPALRAKQ
jgi:hypothetical protein